jgi:hypothetical protein
MDGVSGAAPQLTEPEISGHVSTRTVVRGDTRARPAVRESR